MAHIYPYFLPILTQIIREDIPMNWTQIAILTMTSTLVMIPLTLLFGFLGEKIYKWRLLLIGLGYGIVLSHTFIIYFAPNYGMLILAGVIGGIGASIFHPIALPLLSQEFGANRNIAHSFNLIFGTLGSMLTPISTIYFSMQVGWRNTSLAFGIFGVAIFPILILLLVLARKEIHYKPHEAVMINKKVVILNQKNGNKQMLKIVLSLFTGPIIALLAALIVRNGIFKILNTFTALIFVDEYGVDDIKSALIMSLILALGGISALISGFISKKVGSLKTYLFSNITTTIAALAIVLFTSIITLTSTTINVGLLVVAILLFSLLSIMFYSGNSPSNALLAEMLPLEFVSLINGLLDSLMSSFSIILVVFGKISDISSFPFEYILLILFSIIPLILVFYIKSKVGYKTPDEIECAREKDIVACMEAISK